MPAVHKESALMQLNKAEIEGKSVSNKKTNPQVQKKSNSTPHNPFNSFGVKVVALVFWYRRKQKAS